MGAKTKKRSKRKFIESQRRKSRMRFQNRNLTHDSETDKQLNDENNIVNESEPSTAEQKPAESPLTVLVSDDHSARTSRFDTSQENSYLTEHNNQSPGSSVTTDIIVSIEKLSSVKEELEENESTLKYTVSSISAVTSASGPVLELRPLPASPAVDTDVKPLLIPEDEETLWTNRRCLEFLKRYRAEPCLWDCRLPTYKVRVAQRDAWRRLAGAMSGSPTLQDLKRRRDSLMGYYRMQVHKYKEAQAAGHEFNATWFAFHFMHDFLAPFYMGDSPPSSKVTLSSHPGSAVTNKRRRKIILNKAKAYETTTQRKRRLAKAKMKREEKKEQARAQLLQEGRVLTWIPGQPEGQMITPDRQGSRSPPSLPEITIIRTLKHSPSEHYEEAPGSPQLDPLPGPCKTEPSDSQYDQDSGPSHYDEFDHFGLMIASKVRGIEDFEERERVMSVIQNIVFQSTTRSAPADLPP